MSADNNNENDIVLTDADLAEAKAIIEGLIKADKNKLLFLSTVSSLISSADSVTGKLSAKSLYFLAGNTGTGGLSDSNMQVEEMVQWMVAQRVMQRTDIALHKDYDQRSRNERNSINPEQTSKYSQTMSQSAASYLFQKGKMIKAYASAAVGLCLTGVAFAANPPLAAAVIGGSLVATIPSYFMNKRLKTHKVNLKNIIDEKQKKVASFSRQMYQNSCMTESVNAQEETYKRLADRQKRVIRRGKIFTQKILKYNISMSAWNTACVAGVIATSAAIGLPLATTVLAAAGTASTLAATSRILSGHYGKKEYIETFAMTYKKFKSKYKDFQFGNEKTNPKDNILQLDHIAYRHRINSGKNAGERQDVDFFKSDETITFKPGISVLSGASGAGKSTLTELLMHADNVTGGSIKIGSLDKDGNLVGKDYCNLAMGAPCQNIAISYQRPELTECTVDTYIKLGNPNADPKKVDEIKKLLGIGIENGGTIDDLKLLSPGVVLSGGEQTRIGLAQALIKDSPIMILDEPTSGIDEKMSEDIVNYLKAQKDKTIIYITHDPREIDAIGAYQAVDIGKHSKDDEINTIKSYDLTNPETKKDFIKFFSDRTISEKSEQKERSQASLDKVHQRMQDLVDKRMHERITSGEPISASELQAVKKIKGIAPDEAEKQAKALFSKINAADNTKSR